MIYFGILAALAVTALAGPPLPDNDKSTQTEDHPVPLSDICFFRFPTFYCTMKCQKLGQEAYCDQHKCLCRPDQDHDQDKDKAKDHEAQQDGPAPTSGPTATTLPEHTLESSVAVTPTEEEAPIKCIMGFRPLPCEQRCSQRGLQSHCEARTDGEFCVCVDRQPQNTAVIRLTTLDETPLVCLLGRRPMMCVLRCKLSALDSYCDQRNLCVCGPDNRHEEASEDHDGLNPMCILGMPTMPCHMKCMTEGGQPACDQSQRCECQNPDFSLTDSSAVSVSDETDNGPDDEEEDENSPNIFMYFFKMTKLFGDDNNAEPVPEITVEPQNTADDVIYVSNDGWSYQYLLALLVLGLLCVFILLELLSCYRRKKNRSKVDTIFKPMPNPNKS